MRRLRQVVGLVGAVVVGVALVVLSVPGLARQLPVDQIVSVLGNDYFLVALFAVVALVFVLGALAVRLVSGLDQATPPDPEGVQSAPRLGNDFDDLVTAGVGLRTQLLTDEPERVRERLHSTAVSVEMRESNCSRSDALAAVERGTWTDDRAAAAFLAGDAGPDPSLTQRLRAAVHSQSWFQRGAERTARAIVRNRNGGAA